MKFLALRGVDAARLAAVLSLAASMGAVWGCDTREPGAEVGVLDRDSDGVAATLDCDDEDAGIGGPLGFFSDADGDGLGDPAQRMDACAAPAGFVDNSDDAEPACPTNDTDPCGVCAGDGGATFYPDVDGDGRGDARRPVQTCAAPEGFVGNGDDADPECATDDTDACGVCAGPGPREAFYDGDGDGRGDPARRIEACAIPEGFVDNSDDPDPACATDDTDECGICAGPGVRTVYLDVDDDGLGDDAQAFEACGIVFGAVEVGGDPEPLCATNNTDECGVCGGPGMVDFYEDADDDGRGDPAVVVWACVAPPLFVRNKNDLEPRCATNDTDECEVCGGRGAALDCAGVCFGGAVVDACDVCGGPGELIWFADDDNDGLGDPADFQVACDQPGGYVDNSRDLEPTCPTNDTDGCGVCGGGNGAMDCYGVCGGEAYHDACGRCVGGTTGREPATEDLDMNGVPDLCENCEARARFIVQWTAVPTFAQQGGAYSFQAVLFEDGDVIFQYADLERFQPSATVGVQGPSGQGAIELSFNTTFPTEHAVVTLDRQDNGQYVADYFAPLYWLDIQQVGEALPFGDDDERDVELGFPFPFMGQTYTSVHISANGLLSFSGPFGDYNNDALPAPQLGALIAPLWDDLNPTRGGTIHVYAAPATCERDCNDVLGGFARPSSCGGCVTGPDFGPTTDCAGVCGGTAFRDDCGRCVGGTTGLEPLALDCTGLCNGEAYYDACRVCVGGTTGLEPSDPESCPPGVDLIVDNDYLSTTVSLDHVFVQPNDCLIDERCVRGSGDRKVIRFGTRIANIGTEDLYLGPPSADSEFFHFDACHNHFHFEAYAAYDLFDVNQNTMLDVGSKNGFCVLDIGVYDPALAPNGCNGYGCGNQGISVGCQDTYSPGLQCQWIDVTGIPDGIYDIIVTTNPTGEIPERSTNNNSASVRVRLQGENVTVLP